MPLKLPSLRRKRVTKNQKAAKYGPPTALALALGGLAILRNRRRARQADATPWEAPAVVPEVPDRKAHGDKLAADLKPEGSEVGTPK